MSKEYSKSLIEEIRKIAADYSEAISTLPNVQDYSPEKGKKSSLIILKLQRKSGYIIRD